MHNLTHTPTPLNPLAHNIAGKLLYGRADERQENEETLMKKGPLPLGEREKETARVWGCCMM
jgi:hypothetical protein